MSTRVKLEWTPHPGQQDIHNSDARFKIVACGRRFGKTEFCGYKAFQTLGDPDTLVWWVAPTYDIADIGFDIVDDVIPDALVESVKRTKPKGLTLTNGSKISFRSADREDSLRGEGLDLLIIDEAAMVPDRAWKEELRPALSDTLGDMIAISTPKGRNWFHDYFQRGQSDDHHDVDSWQEPTYSNPHVPDEEVDAAQYELPERVFEQEYLAKFLEESGGVFTGIDAVSKEFDPDDVDGDGPYSIGVDFARHQDHTVIIALDSNAHVVHYERFRSGGQVTWPQIQRRVEDVFADYQGRVYVDATRDNKIVGDLEAAGVSVEPIRFSATKKADMIENLAARIEQENITLPANTQLVTELQIMEYDISPSGNVRYHAPEGHHDDCVDALALACEGLGKGMAVGSIGVGSSGESGNMNGLPGLGRR